MESKYYGSCGWHLEQPTYLRLASKLIDGCKMPMQNIVKIFVLSSSVI